MGSPNTMLVDAIVSKYHASRYNMCMVKTKISDKMGLLPPLC